MVGVITIILETALQHCIQNKNMGRAKNKTFFYIFHLKYNHQTFASLKRHFAALLEKNPEF